MIMLMLLVMIILTLMKTDVNVNVTAIADVNTNSKVMIMIKPNCDEMIFIADSTSSSGYSRRSKWRLGEDSGKQQVTCLQKYWRF